jgi:hypothetical protein
LSPLMKIDPFSVAPSLYSALSGSLSRQKDGPPGNA